MISSRRASLLVVPAHPDDELFHGGMRSHLSERGVRVTLACATNGEAGKPHPSVGSVDDLGQLRAICRPACGSVAMAAAAAHWELGWRSLGGPVRRTVYAAEQRGRRAARHDVRRGTDFGTATGDRGRMVAR